MIEAFSYLLEIAGVILLIIGYRKSNRNMLLAAAVLLWVGCGVPEFVEGFTEGLQSAR
jgi:uncharacterized membrane protein